MKYENAPELEKNALESVYYKNNHIYCIMINDLVSTSSAFSIDTSMVSQYHCTEGNDITENISYEGR
jgi:hypothetical protein